MINIKTPFKHVYFEFTDNSSQAGIYVNVDKFLTGNKDG